MADISLGGGNLPPQQTPSVRPPERVESERREAVDSDIERGEAERSEATQQNKDDQAAFARAKQEQTSSDSHRVDVLV